MANTLHEMLWTHLWQIGVLTLLVAVLTAVGGRRWPHLAYALWLVVLAKCFVPPIWGWSAGVPGWNPPKLITSTVSATADEGTGGEARLPVAHSATALPSTAAPAPVEPDADDPTRALPPVRGWLPAASTLQALWALGSALLAGAVLGRVSERRRLLRHCSRPAPDRVRRAVERARTALGARQSVPVYCTSSNFGPGVIGTWRPEIYLPNHLVESMSDEQLQTMLAHELSHVRRGDAWVAHLQLVAQILWWFHPLVWWMNRQLVQQRERCCDEEVVSALDGKRREYARCLVDVLQAKLSIEPLWGHPGLRPAELTRRRLEEIMKRPNMKHRRAPRWARLVALTLALAVLPGGGSPWIAQGDEAPAAADVGTSPDAQGSPTGRTPTILKYGDNKPDGRKSIAGAGQMIRFALPEGVTQVRGLRIHCARYGYPQPPKEDVEITFLTEDMTESLHTELVPYSLFKRTKANRWTTVPLDDTVDLPEKFWVVLNFSAERTKGVYVSYDTETKGQYSRVGFNEEDARETDFAGDWMVQVQLPRQRRIVR